MHDFLIKRAEETVNRASANPPPPSPHPLFTFCVHVIKSSTRAISVSFEDTWSKLALVVLSLFQVLLELGVCSIHILPLPLFAFFPDVDTTQVHAELEGTLAVLIFLRLYVIIRTLVAHSPLANEAQSSLGALNKVCAFYFH
jgi:hypothetical protein